LADRNFVSVLRALPYWPNDLIPLDELIDRLAGLLGVPPATGLLNGALGVRNVEVVTFDGVTSVTGEAVFAAEIVFAPAQDYVGLVIGEVGGGLTSFPFELTLSDEPPLRNGDDVLDPVTSPADPQVGAFQFPARDPEAGFLDFGSWTLWLTDVPVKVRMLKGVTRVEPIDPGVLTRGFRDVPGEHVDAGLDFSVRFSSDGEVERWPPDPRNPGGGDALSSLDLDLGWFRVGDSPLVINATGLGYHKAGAPWPVGVDPPPGVDQSWEGFVAAQVAGMWAPKEAAVGSLHVYGGEISDLFWGSDVFSAKFSFLHGGGPQDPFESQGPVAEADLPDHRLSLRRIDLSVTNGVGDVLQITGHVRAGAIIDFFDNRPLMFDLSLGRVLRDVPGGSGQQAAYVELQGGVSAVQNAAELTPEGYARVELVGLDATQAPVIGYPLALVKPVVCWLSGARFGLAIPADDTPGLPWFAELAVDLTIEAGGTPSEPRFAAAVDGLGMRYASSGDNRFEVLMQGVAIQASKAKAIDLWGYKLAVNNLNFGVETAGDHNRWFGFDATVGLPGGIGRGTVYGLRVGWGDPGAFFDIGGVGIGAKGPGWELYGELKFLDGPVPFDPGQAENGETLTVEPGSLSGAVRVGFTTEGTQMAVQLGLLHGHYHLDSTPDDRESFWMFSGELLFPAGVPLGLADLSFYGLSVMMGANVAPRRLAGQSWFEWYADQTPRYEISAPGKWTAAHHGTAFGIGLLFGSQLDAGYPYNGRLMFAVSDAGDDDATWLIEGRMRMLDKITASGDPNIALLVVISPREVLVRAELLFELPKKPPSAKGLVATLRGMVEILSDRTGDGAHHVYLGRNQPLSERLDARALLGFLGVRAFYMLDWQPLALSGFTLQPVAFACGLVNEWKFDERFGPLRLYVEAGVAAELGFTFTSAVFGYAQFYGGAGIRLWGFGFGISFDTSLALAIANDDWSLDGELKVKLNLPWPIPDYKKTLPWHWGGQPSPPQPLRSPLRQLAVTGPAMDGAAPVTDWSDQGQLETPEGFDPDAAKLPVDGSLVLALAKPCSADFDWLDGVDLQPVDGSGKWRFRYTLDDLELLRTPPGGSEQPVPADEKWATWDFGLTPAQPSAPTDGSFPAAGALHIWGEPPGEQLRVLGGLDGRALITWLDAYLDIYRTWPCGPDVDLDPVCLHYDQPSVAPVDDRGTRITQLEGGGTLESRPLIHPDDPMPHPLDFAILGGVIANPAPGEIPERGNLLALPYLYRHATVISEDYQGQNLGYLPYRGGLEIGLPECTRAEVVVYAAYPLDTVVVTALDQGQAVAAAGPLTGQGRLTLEVATSSEEPFDGLRVEVTRDPGWESELWGNLAERSCLASVCFVTADQERLEEHVEITRDRLDDLLSIYQEPQNPPGENAAAFGLHAPGTVYRLKPWVSVERRGPEDTSPWETVHSNIQLAPVTVEVGPPPEDLAPYIDETVPASGQTPVYLAHDVRLRFNRAYGPELYTVGGDDLRVEVQDPEGRAVPQTLEITFSEEPALSPGAEMLLEALLSGPCVSADFHGVRKKLELVLHPDLEPRTAYKLVFLSSAHPGKTLLEVPFTTSAYEDFASQAQELEVNAYQERLPAPPSLPDLDDVAQRYPYDDGEIEDREIERLWESILGQGPPHDPAQGERVALYADDGGGVSRPWAIRLHSPEPLFVRRRTVLSVTGPGSGSIAQQHIVLRSADGRRALILALRNGRTEPLDAGDYVLGLTYRRSASGLPTQSVDGDTGDQVTTVSFTLSDDPDFAEEPL